MWCSSNSRSTRSRAGDGSLCATTGSRGDVLHRHLPALGQRVRRRHQQHELVAADRHLEQALLGRMERQRAEVEAALLHFDGDLTGRHAAHVDRDVGIALRGSARSAAAACGRPLRWRRSARGRAAGRAARARPTRSPRQAAPAAGRSSGASRPASVSVPLFDERSNSCSPRSTSSRRTAWLTAGCVRCTFAAAREKLRSCATARKILQAPGPDVHK